MAADEGAGPVLEVRGLTATYGEAVALRDVSLTLGRGEVVTLVGRNGAGKTTLLRCVMGLHRSQTGEVRLHGRALGSMRPQRRARLGLGWVPDDRGILASLSVEENLRLPPVVGERAWSMEQVHEVFPALAERRRFPGTRLSGGEQQMLAMARVLRMGCDVLLLDEPTEGLSPVLVTAVRDIVRAASDAGTSVLLVEQNLGFATTVADRHYLLAQGEVAQQLENHEVKQRQGELLEYLGV
ncbi:MAG TPA: ABC transporter ATP-binding protein [Actinomycetales bacterium]|nr:ABC transporter ATP-binding protein [Actinomycetales bacterium]